MVIVQGDVEAYLHPTDPSRRSSNVYTCPGCNVNHDPLAFRCKTKDCKGVKSEENMYHEALRDLHKCVNKCVDLKLQMTKKEIVENIMQKIFRTL